MSSRKPPSFGALKISANNLPAGTESVRAVGEPAADQMSSGKPPKTIPVRLTHEQWYEAKEFGMREDQSLQELFIAGLNMLRAAKGLPPLTGTRHK